MCLGAFCLRFICLAPSGFLGLRGFFLLHFREVFNYYLLEYFLMYFFLFVFFFWDSYDLNVVVFNTVPEVSEVVLLLKELQITKPYIFTNIIIIAGALQVFFVYFPCNVLIHLEAMISCSFGIMQEGKPSLCFSILRSGSLPLCIFCKQ